MQFNADYPDDDACLEALFMHRYGDMKYCPRCGVVAAEFMRVEGRKSYACVHCRYQLYPMADTIFHGTKLSLKLWFTALYLFSVSKNGVAAAELERALNIPHKTAWRVATSIRRCMHQETNLLRGRVEADEAYYGGRRRSSNRFRNKTPILGAVERNGKARVVVIHDAPTAYDVTEFIGNNVAVTATLYTDESVLYKRVGKVYDRQSVKHGVYEFVRDEDVYTNTIEGFWGLMKPYLNGTHRSVSKQYLQTYVNEAVWKYNRRDQDSLYASLLQAAAQPVTRVS